MNPAQTKEDAKQRLKKVNEWLENKNYKPEQFISDEVISFDGDCGRIGIIWIGKQECLCCHSKKPCLVVDQSEGEYAQATICFDCIEILRRANL